VGYEKDEFVNLGFQGPLTLVSAIQEFVEMPFSEQREVTIYRDVDRTPASLGQSECRHLADEWRVSAVR